MGTGCEVHLAHLRGSSAFEGLNVLNLSLLDSLTLLMGESLVSPSSELREDQVFVTEAEFRVDHVQLSFLC